jgi:DMSO reductase anchor subunit
VIGLRHSWLSREVLAFGLFAKLATAHVAIEVFWPTCFDSSPTLRLALIAAIVSAGLAGVVCSVMVYHAVRRPFWRSLYGSLRFGGTTTVLGLATVLASIGCSTVSMPKLLESPGPSRIFFAVAALLITAAAAKLWFERRLVRGCARSELASLRSTAWLLCGPLKRPAGLRRFLGVVGGVVLPALAIVGAATADTGITSFAALCALTALIGGETAERYLFFTAVVRPRLPGGLG